ncbi:MAG: nitrous oxide reductase family maturation protein NosD [Limisphaerales bacterium]
MKLLPVAVLACIVVGPSVNAATLHVPAQHARIQAAVDAAKAGDTVLVAAGTYRERVTLKTGVTLRSAGDDAPGKLGLKRAEATVIDGGGTPEPRAGVELAAGSVLDGFTIANVGRYDDAEWQRHFATRGTEQPHEHIGAPGVAGVSVRGVNCEVRNNSVRHTGYTGIAITGVAGAPTSPLIVSNICHRNMGGGIGSMNGSTAIIRGNTCFENFYAGIGHENASPLVESNRCFGNIRAGIGISEGASPTVRFNLCYDNRRAGIGIRTGENTRPIVERNDCLTNGMAGIGTEESAAPELRFNRCHGNGAAGIGARDHARPLILGNECVGNADAGIGLMTGHGTLVASNLCRLNKSAGIGLAGGGTNTATLTENRLLENAAVALGVNAGWHIAAAGNELVRTEGLPPLVMVAAGATANFTNNVLRGGGVAALRMAGQVRAEGNEFTSTPRKGGPPGQAVWALPGASVELVGNRFTGWRSALVAESATVVARKNVVKDAVGVAFRVKQPAAPPQVGENEILGAGVRELEVDGK